MSYKTKQASLPRLNTCSKILSFDDCLGDQARALRKLSFPERIPAPRAYGFSLYKSPNSFASSERIWRLGSKEIAPLEFA